MNAIVAQVDEQVADARLSMESCRPCAASGPSRRRPRRGPRRCGGRRRHRSTGRGSRLTHLADRAGRPRLGPTRRAASAGGRPIVPQRAPASRSVAPTGSTAPSARVRPRVRTALGPGRPGVRSQPRRLSPARAPGPARSSPVLTFHEPTRPDAALTRDADASQPDARDRDVDACRCARPRRGGPCSRRPAPRLRPRSPVRPGTSAQSSRRRRCRPRPASAARSAVASARSRASTAVPAERPRPARRAARARRR